MAVNYDLNNTGQEVQERLDQVMPNKSDIAQEVLDRQAGDTALQEQITAINNEIGESGQGGETINGRLDELEAAVGSGGSVDERIAAAETEIIGGATEDYDTLGKIEGIVEQNKSEQEAVNDDTYRKAETYSKDQLDSLITTPDVEYVTVTAVSTTTDVTTLLPNPGAADTVYRVGNWDGTQYDPTLYSLYAWNGSAYILLTVRTSIGEVYDISVNHPDGQGNPAVYTDLDNALGTNGINVPDDIRHGGMIVKFIQGSEYVQYRLMSTAWSTTPSDWQGVDEEPTAGSRNLVKSGGVALTTEDVALISWGITFEFAGSSDYKRVDIIEGRTYKIVCAATVKFSFYDENRTLVQSVSADSVKKVAYLVASGNACWIKAGAACSCTITYKNFGDVDIEALPKVEEYVGTLPEYLFNSDTKNWVYQKTSYIAKDSSSEFLSYLGKCSCEFTIDSDDGNNDIKVQGRNVASNNYIDLYSADDVSFPQTFTNPRPDLEFDIVRVVVKSTGSRGWFTLKIEKPTPFEGVRQDIVTNAKGITFLNDADSLFKEGIAISVSSSKYQAIRLKAGRSYSLQCDNNATVTIWNEDRSEKAGGNINATAGKTVIFTPSSDAYWIKAGVSFTGVLWEAANTTTIVETSNKVDNVAFDVALGREGVTLSIGSGKLVAVDLKAGKSYSIYSENGTTLSFWNSTDTSDDNNRTAGSISFDPGWTKVITPYARTYYIKSGSATTILIKDVVDILMLQDARLDLNSYQFGVGIDCRYNTPTQLGFSNPAAGQRLSYYYGLYDQLVTDYPGYVTKIDCDAECVAAGLERPSYMEGYPIYMYKFVPANAYKDTYTKKKGIIKVFITTGTHPEYMAIMDCYLTMKLICDSWASDANLESLRWDAEFYIMPCSGSWTVENFGLQYSSFGVSFPDHNTIDRANYNGVDLNRNAPSVNYYPNRGTQGYDWSGTEANSEYENKVFTHYMEDLQPNIYIDHHNSNDGQTLIWGNSDFSAGADILAHHISDMSRRLSQRFNTILPSNTIFGHSSKSTERGTRQQYACDLNVFGFTYETMRRLLYDNGEYVGNNNTPYAPFETNITTMMTDCWVNLLLRILKTYSEIH